MLVRWTAAFSHALICHVRDDTDLNRELSTVLLPHEVSAATKAQPNATSFILQVTTHHLLTCQPRTLQLWWRGCAGGLGRTSAWWGAELACPCWASAATFRPTPPPPPPTPTPPLPPRPQVISELVDQCQLPDLKDERMFSSVRTMADAVGKCDVLLRYPVPLGGWPPQLGRLSAGCSDRVGGRRSWPAGSHVGCAAGRAVLPRHEPPSLPPPSSRLAAGYTRHTSRFLLMWLLALPFALWPQCSWASVPYTTGIAFLLLGIEDIGVQASVTGHGCAGKCHGAWVRRQVSRGIGVQASIMGHRGHWCAGQQPAALWRGRAGHTCPWLGRHAGTQRRAEAQDCGAAVPGGQMPGVAGGGGACCA
jgi:hypothetical protein